MQSTPVRVSILALGTVTTLAAYGLGKTNATTPDEKPKTPDPANKKKTTKPFPFLAPKTSIAKPEQSPAQLKVVPVPGSLAALRNTTPKPIQSPPAIQRISVDQLPIDNILASTLPSEKAATQSTQPKSAAKPIKVPTPPPPPANTSTQERIVAANPQVAIATPTPPALRPESSANTISATEVDDSSYALGPGDQIRVELFNVPEYSRDYQVLVNGTVNLYLVGPLSVKGMTPLEAQAAIAAKYAPIVSRARVDVTLLATRPVRVAIAGEVAHPGTYPLSTPGNTAPTLTQLIQQAGGITQAANARRVQIRRPQRSGSPLLITSDLWALTTEADTRQDLVLRDGDAVVIPTLENINLAEATQIAAANIATDPKKAINIAVVGEVMRPGSQILAQTGGALPTLSQAIQQAGGIAPLANVREVEVRRTTRKGTTQVTRLNLWELLASGDSTQDMVLQQGDTVVIPKGTVLTAAESSKIQGSTFAAASIRVSVVGEVERPGTLEVTPSTPLNQAILSAGGFNRRANKKSVHLLRLNPDGTVTRQPISIDLATGVDEKGNPMLRNNDVILVDRSGGAKASDTLSDIGGFLGKILPFGFLLR